MKDTAGIVDNGIRKRDSSTMNARDLDETYG